MLSFSADNKQQQGKQKQQQQKGKPYFLGTLLTA